MLEQSWDLLLEYLGQLPQLEMYRAYPLAQMMAIYANANGGKKSGGKKPRPEELFTPLEFLAYFAQPPEVQDALKYGGSVFSPRECRLIADAVEQKSLPSWAIQMIDQLQPLEVLVLAAKPSLRKSE